MFLEKAVLQQPISLFYIDEKLKEDIDIIDNAFSSNPYVFTYLKEKICQESYFCEYFIKQNPKVAIFYPFQKNELIEDVLKQDGMLLQYFLFH